MRLEIDQNVVSAPPLDGKSFDNLGFPGTNDPETLLKKGISAAQNGDRDGARKLLTQVAALDPNCEDAWMWLASISDYPEELLAFLKRVLEINPKNSRAAEWHSATNALLARTFVQRAVAANHEDSRELAAQCLAQAFAYDSNCESAWEFKASLTTDEDEKLECLERVLSINPDNEDAMAGVAVIQRAKVEAVFADAKAAVVEGDNKKGLALVETYLETVVDNADAWVLKAHLTNDVEQKMSSLERALEANPNHAAARSSYDFLSTLKSAPQHQTVEEPQELAQPEEFFAEPAEASHSEEVMPGPADVSADIEPAQAVEAVADEEPEAEGEADAEEEVFAADVSSEDVEEEPVFTSDDAVEEFSAADDAVEETPVSAPEAELQASFDSQNEDASFPTADLIHVPDTGVACAFCGNENDSHAFTCGKCQAVISLSDTERLLANPYADLELIHPAVMRLESEVNSREFSDAELVALGIGHFNLRNYEAGLRYLQEAVRRDPNNVVLSSNVNTLAIRVEEIDHQNELVEPRPQGKTILVVDDSPTVRKLISGKLERSGHIVVCASDGVEALERINDSLPDLVLLDITMPRMDGYEVCKQIRANPEAKNLPVVMISGKDGFFDKVRGKMAGTTGYVTKPFGPETLMKALETYLLPDAA